MKKITLVAAVCFLAIVCQAQKIDKQDLKFDYIELPTNPLDRSIKNYTSQVILAYEGDVAKLKQENQAKYEKEKAEYPDKVAQAEADFNKRMEKYKADKAEYDKKSLGTKFFEKGVLAENNKPHEPYYVKPSEPVFREIKTSKMFDKNMLASSYLKLDGFSNSPTNGLKITATLYGFDALEPELKSKEENVFSTQTQSTQKQITYWYETQYKHPINIKVELPTGEVLMDEVPQEFANYSIAKASRPNFDKRQFIDRLESQVVEDNMKALHQLLNIKYGYRVANRQTIIYFIKPKKFTYEDYQQAYENAMSGYNLLSTDYTNAAQKLNAACDIWEKALTEYVYGAKKVRIDEDVAKATHFNLAEAYIFSNNFEKAETHLSKIIGMDPSGREKRTVAELRDLLKVQRAIWDVNKNN